MAIIDFYYYYYYYYDQQVHFKLCEEAKKKKILRMCLILHKVKGNNVKNSI